MNATAHEAPATTDPVPAAVSHPAGGFPAFFEAMRGQPMGRVVRESERRRAEACQLGGYDLAVYNRRAEAFVEALLARAPLAVRADPFAPVLAYAYASHRALRDARAAALRAPGRDAYPCYGQAAELSKGP